MPERFPVTGAPHGIIPPLVTPLTGPDQLDEAGLERLIERILEGGVAGAFVLGTTGEAPSLSARLKQQMIRESCRLARGRLPVLVGIGDTCLQGSLTLAHHAAEAGAQAVVLTAPFFFRVDQAELEAWTLAVARASPLPVVVYNIPSLTKAVFELTTLERLRDEPRIIGVKDSSADLAYFGALCEVARQRPDWSVWVGPEELLAQCTALGGRGGVNGGALLHPRLFVDLFQAAAAGERSRAEDLQAEVLALGRIYRVTDHPAGVLKSIKCALSLLGICGGQMAPPLQEYGDRERAEVQKRLEAVGLLPDACQPELL